MSDTQVKTDKKKKSLGVFSALAVGVVLSLYVLVIVGMVFGVRDGWLAELWTNLEGDGRANVIASMVTALGLLSSAVILPFVFRDRISSLSDMVDNTEKDLKKLNETTSDKLDKLTKGFEEQLSELQRKSNEKADEGQELVVALYAAVTTLLGQGHVTDSNHADRIVKGLWEKAKLSCRERLNAKKALWQTTKDNIRSMRIMSDEYLAAMENVGAISREEKDTLLRLRRLRYVKRAPNPDEFGIVRQLQETVEQFSQSDENGNGHGSDTK
nr:hypothetical protein [uncultured Hyphomonas sp.]